MENNLLEQASSLGHEMTIFIESLMTDLQEHLCGVYELSSEFEYTKISFLGVFMVWWIEIVVT